MSKRFSYRTGEKLVFEFSLAFTADGDVRLTRGAPALDAGEREMRMAVTLPLSIFRRPQLHATINIADTPVKEPEIDVQAARDALRDAIGADVAIHIVQAAGAS